MRASGESRAMRRAWLSLPVIAVFAVRAARADAPVATSTADEPTPAATVSVVAAPAPAPPADVAHGWRVSLAAHGVETSASLTGLWIGDVAGGLRTGGVYNTLGLADATIDLAKVAHWRGAHAYVSGAWIRGRSLSWYNVGDALGLSNLDGFDSVRLYQFYVEQSFAGDRGSLRIGSTTADEEFAGTSPGGSFTNSAFGWPSFISANTVNTGPAYYVPALGVRLGFALREHWTVRAGVWDGDTFDSPDGEPSYTQHGLHLSLGHGQGAFGIAESEMGWSASGRDGVLKLGAWGHSGPFADVERDASGQPFAMTGNEPATHDGILGPYASLEQAIVAAPHDGGPGLVAWVRGGTAPADRASFSWTIDGGLSCKGPLPGRRADAFAVGVAHAAVSGSAIASERMRQLVDGEPGPLPDFERVLEVAYAAKLGEHWTATPDAQFIAHPGTSRAIPAATVLGLRVAFTP